MGADDEKDMEALSKFTVGGDSGKALEPFEQRLAAAEKADFSDMNHAQILQALSETRKMAEAIRERLFKAVLDKVLQLLKEDGITVITEPEKIIFGTTTSTGSKVMIKFGPTPRHGDEKRSQRETFHRVNGKLDTAYPGMTISFVEESLPKKSWEKFEKAWFCEIRLQEKVK